MKISVLAATALVVSGSLAPFALRAEQAPAAPDAPHLHQGHRADPAAQLRELPSRRRRRADVARHLRRGAAVGARHQAAHRHRPEGRRDAAVVRREEHRHPEVPERSVAERRRDREDRQVGRQRRAARQPRRHAAARKCTPTRNAWAIGTPDLIVKTQGARRQGRRARLVGRDPERPDRARPRTATSRRSRSRKSTTSTSKHGSGRATVGGRFVFHHMIWRTQVLDAARRRARIRVAIRRRRDASTGRCTKSAATPTSSIRSRRAC